MTKTLVTTTCSGSTSANNWYCHGFPFWISRTTELCYQNAAADAEVLEIPHSEGVPESMDGRYRLSPANVTGNRHIFNGCLDTSASLPPFSPRVRLSEPIFILPPPPTPRPRAPCFRTTGASDGSPQASAGAPATGFPGGKRSNSTTTALNSAGRDDSSAASSSPPVCLL